MLNRLASRISPPISRCTSPDIRPSLPLRPYRTLTQSEKYYQKVSSAIEIRNKSSSEASPFSSAKAQAVSSAGLSSDLGFENLLVKASRHRVKCYASFTSRNDDYSEYSDFEEQS